MKSGDAFRFSLHWAADSEDRILAGEFLEKLGNRKSRFIIQLVCEYLATNPEVIDPKETIQLVFSSPAGGHLAEIVRSIVRAELACKAYATQILKYAEICDEAPSDELDIDRMFDNLDIWNSC